MAEEVRQKRCGRREGAAKGPQSMRAAVYLTTKFVGEIAMVTKASVWLADGSWTRAVEILALEGGVPTSASIQLVVRLRSGE